MTETVTGTAVPSTASAAFYASPNPQLEHWSVIEAKARAEAAQADALLANHLANAAGLAFQKDHDRWLYDNAGEMDRRILRFPAQVDQDSVARSIDILSRWNHLEQGNELPFTIVITSPGGEIFSGISLYTYLRRLGETRPVITIASGICASMATIIHQAGTVRQIERASTYLIHDASTVARGDVNALRDQAEWIQRINDSLHDILAERSSLNKEEISERSRRRDWTLNAEQTVEYGFADKVI